MSDHNHIIILSESNIPNSFRMSFIDLPPNILPAILDTDWTSLNLKIIKIQFSPYYISYGVVGTDLE